LNPPHQEQDGVNCQFAAILDQLQLLGRLPSELNVVGLKRLAFAWLTEHGNNILDAQWDDPVDPTRELMLVRSFIPDFDEFVANHPTLVAVCVVLKESYNLLVHIQVRVGVRIAALHSLLAGAKASQVSW
jgi:hypothetical protein